MSKDKEVVSEVKVAGSEYQIDGRGGNARAKITIGQDLGLKQDDAVIITWGPRGNVISMQHVSKKK